MFVEGNLGLVEHSLLPGNILDYDLTYKYAFSVTFWPAVVKLIRNVKHAHSIYDTPDQPNVGIRYDDRSMYACIYNACMSSPVNRTLTSTWNN